MGDVRYMFEPDRTEPPPKDTEIGATVKEIGRLLRRTREELERVESAVSAPNRNAVEAVSPLSQDVDPDVPQLSDLELHSRIRRGLPISELDELMSRFGIRLEEISEALDISKRTIGRRRKVGRLQPAESDRLYRLRRLAEMARTVLGDHARASAWLHESNQALGDQSPLSLAGSEVGCRQIEALLGRIEYGVYS